MCKSKNLGVWYSIFLDSCCNLVEMNTFKVKGRVRLEHRVILIDMEMK